MGKGLHLTFLPPVAVGTPTWTDNEDLTGEYQIELNRAGYAAADRGAVSGTYTESSFSYDGSATVGNPILKKARIHTVPFPDPLFGSPEVPGDGFVLGYATESGGAMTAVDIERDAPISASSFTSPLSVAGIWGWYRPGFGQTSSGGDLLGWYDQTGFGRHMLGIYSTNPQKQLDGTVTFDGISQGIGHGFAIAQPFDVIVRFKALTPVGITSLWGDLSNLTMAAFYPDNANVSLYAGNAFACANAAMAATGSYVTAFCHFEGPDSFTRTDGAANITGNPGTGAANGFTFGICEAQGSNANIQIAEIVFLQGRTTGASLDDDFDDLDTYLSGVTP